MERMITLWYGSCQSRLCLKRLGLTWINATPYKQFAELFSKRAFDSHPIVLFLQYAKRKGTHFRVPFLVERMITLWYGSCQSRLCLKRLGLTWINATPYKQFAELFSKRAFDSHPIVLFLQYAKRKGTHFRVPFLVERMITLWYGSCQSRLCLKRLGLTWINATPYKQFTELFSKRAFDSHLIVLFFNFAKRKGTQY